jgi:phosphomannomutase
MLDRLAESFGETCYEVPVGFKHISQKIEETDAVLGGESSGGLTVRGHIHGKDSVYAAALLVEALCALQKSPAEIVDELYKKLGPQAIGGSQPDAAARIASFFPKYPARFLSGRV